MNHETLHQCNLDEIYSYTNYKELLAINDGLVFYAESISQTKQIQLKNEFKNIEIHFVCINNKKSYIYWVQLVDKFKRTLTWK